MRNRCLRVRAVALLSTLIIAAVTAGCTVSNGSGGDTGSGDLAGCAKDPNGCNSAPVRAGGSLSFAITTPISNWNLRTPAGTAEADYDVLYGILPFAFDLQPDGTTTAMNKNLLTSAEQVSSSPQTIVYKLNPDAVWSDGTPFSVDDFVYNWHLADGKHCPKCQVAFAGYDQITSMTGSDGGKTITVVLDKPFTDWRMLFSPMLPAHVASTYGDIDTPDGLATGFNDGFVTHVPHWSAGPMTITQADAENVIIEKPNPKWWGTKPALASVDFRVVTDVTQLPTAMSNGEVDATSVAASPDLADQLGSIDGVHTYVGSGCTLSKLILNVANTALTKPLRQAILLAVDRQDILTKVLGSVGSRVEAVDNLNFSPGEAGYRDDVTPSRQGSGDITRAKAVLADAGYHVTGGTLHDPNGKAVPTMRFVYSSDDAGGSPVGQLIAAQLQKLGIGLHSLASRDLSQLTTGAFDIFDITAGIAAFPYYAAQVFFTSDGDGNFGHYSNHTVDDLIRSAAQQSDPKQAATLLNRADAIQVSDAVVLPLFTQPTLAAIRDTFANIRPAAASYLSYNIGSWGRRRS